MSEPDMIHVGPNVQTLLLRALRRYPDRPAFVSAERTIRYRAVDDFLGRAQAALARLGVKRGDMVGALARNGVEAWLIGQAAQAMGASTTNLHPMGSLDDHLQQIATAKPTRLFVDASAYAERGAQIAAAGTGCALFSLGPSDFGPDFLAMVEAVGSATFTDVSDPYGVAACHFTGGTTGKPKQMMTRHHRLAAGINAFSSNFELPATPRVLAAGPITHVTGSLLLPTFMRGGAIHMTAGFDVQKIMAMIERDRINTALMVPTMIYTLLDAPGFSKADLSSLEFLLYSASPMSPPRLLEALDRLGPIFAQLYAQTECGPIAYMPKADHDPAHPERFSACGFPVPQCAVRLVGADDTDVAPGETGEICVRAPFAVEGYVGDPAATAEALRGGWLHTGDIARADEQGRLYIVDRKKDMIVTGGFNVFPREVEDAIAAIPEVAVSAVIGVPDDHWGEAVCAYVVVRPGAEVTAEAVMGAVKAAKGSVKTPKQVRFVDSLPLTGAGKIDKKPLREAAWAGAERRVH